MTLAQLLVDLATKDISLWLEDGQLRFSAPEGAMTEALLATLKDKKPELIVFLQKANQGDTSLSKVPSTEEGYATSFAQQRFWLLQQLEPTSSAYHIHGTFKIKGKIEAEKLKQAFQEIVYAHRIFRMRYHQEGAVLKQKDSTFTPAFIIKSSSPSMVLADCASITQPPFNLGEGEVIRAGIFETAPEETYFSLAMHHIISDGLTLTWFIKQLLTQYQTGIKSPAHEFDYIDFSAFEQAQSLDHELAYWKETLNQVPELALPYDRPASDDNKAAFCDISLSVKESNALKQLAADQGITLFTLLVSAYGLLLQKYTELDDFAIGTPVAGRNISEVADMPGCFINTLALRLNLEAKQSLTQYLTQTATTLSEAFKHQSAPFEEIKRHLDQTFSIDTPPVFQTLFSLQPETPTSIDLGNLTVEEVPSPIDVQYDLKLSCNEYESLNFRFEYKASRFFEATIGRMALNFISLLKALPRALSTPIGAINCQTDNHNWLIEKGEFNDTAKPLLPLCIHKVFEQQCSESPTAIAVSDSTQRLTYQKLNSKANQLAHWLVREGITPNSVIGLSMDRRCELLIAQLAILKAGCAYLPLDKHLPEVRLNAMLEKARVLWVLTDESQSLEGVTCINAVNITTSELPDSNLTFDNPDSLLNVIFTSGSTGTPKGVMVSHRAIHNRLDWMQSAFPLDQDDIILQKTPYSFDVSVWEFFWPIMTGASLHFLEPDAHKDPAAIANRLSQDDITRLHFVPSMLTPFLASNQERQEPFEQVRTVFCSGEPLTQPQVEKAYQLFPHAQIVNLYGPTEAAIDVSYYVCQPNDSHASVPIGKPIQNTQLHILNELQQPVPFGLAGELYIGGTGLAEGYINEEAMTDSRFIENQNPDHPSLRLYRTGDIVKMSHDNELLYLGRNDTQVKIRGQRLELGDIEQTIIRELHVQQAVVLLNTQPTTNESVIVAYVPQGQYEPHELSTRLKPYLSDAMLPRYFVEIDNWPLTVSGKIDRKKLPEPDWKITSKTPFVAPSTETQEALANIFGQVLGIATIGIHDNFFELGGHSLHAMNILMQIQKEFSVELSLKDALTEPTIEVLSEIIDQAVAAQGVFSEENTHEDSESFIL